jgi:hypothetical protein
LIIPDKKDSNKRKEVNSKPDLHLPKELQNDVKDLIHLIKNMDSLKPCATNFVEFLFKNNQETSANFQDATVKTQLYN